MSFCCIIATTLAHGAAATSERVLVRCSKLDESGHSLPVAQFVWAFCAGDALIDHSCEISSLHLSLEFVCFASCSLDEDLT